MKQIGNYVVKALIAGAIVVVPIYLAILLLLKAAGSLLTLVQPIAALLPEWFPAENVLSLLLVLIVCFLIGIAVRTPTGQAARERIEKTLFQRIPRLRAPAKSHAAHSRRESGERLEASPSRDRGGPRPCVHY